jgi:hypothetical protein
VERLADEQRARKQSLGDTRQATGTESESEDDGPGGSMSGLEQGNGMAGSQDLAFDTVRSLRYVFDCRHLTVMAVGTGRGARQPF